jgi:hypothetical protein
MAGLIRRRRVPAERVPDDAPILVLASGQRCGSTLIQRFLASHPDITLWGEHNGVLLHIFQAVHSLEWWSRNDADESRQAFARSGHGGWIPNLMPEEEVAREAGRSFVRRLFAEPAGALGTSRWGFKEVRYGADAARAFRHLFPGARVIHLTRDPRAVLRSLQTLVATGDWDPEATLEAFHLWAYINQSFLELGDQPWLLSVRLEDVTADPSGFAARAAAHVALDANDFDNGIWDTSVRWAGRTKAPADPPPPAPAVTEYLAQPDFRQLAAQYGYELG